MIILVSVSLSFILAKVPESIEFCVNNEGSLVKENSVSPNARLVHEQYSASLMDIPEIIGTALGNTENGKECILVLTKKDISTSYIKAFLPAQFESVPVKIMVTGDLSNEQISQMRILMPTLITGC